MQQRKNCVNEWMFVWGFKILGSKTWNARSEGTEDDHWLQKHLFTMINIFICNKTAKTALLFKKRSCGKTFCSPHILSNVVNIHRVRGCSAMESSEDEHVLFAIKDDAIGGVVTWWKCSSCHENSVYQLLHAANTNLSSGECFPNQQVAVQNTKQWRNLLPGLHFDGSPGRWCINLEKVKKDKTRKLRQVQYWTYTTATLSTTTKLLLLFNYYYSTTTTISIHCILSICPAAVVLNHCQCCKFYKYSFLL